MLVEFLAGAGILATAGGIYKLGHHQGYKAQPKPKAPKSIECPKCHKKVTLWHKNAQGEVYCSECR